MPRAEEEEISSIASQQNYIEEKTNEQHLQDLEESKTQENIILTNSVESDCFILNPPVAVCKGRPPEVRLKSSLELMQNKVKKSGITSQNIQAETLKRQFPFSQSSSSSRQGQKKVRISF